MAKKSKLIEASVDKKRVVTKTIEVLESLFELFDNLTMHNINRYQAYLAINKVYPKYSKSQSARLLQNLTSRGYINKIQQERGGISVEFTGKATMKIVDKIAASIGFSNNLHFVSFDIPEWLHTERDKFRISVKRMGFIKVQQSLWVINKDVGELVEKIAYELGIEKYIVYIVSAKSDIDGILFKQLQK